jgi:hypothetical protein
LRFRFDDPPPDLDWPPPDLFDWPPPDREDWPPPPPDPFDWPPPLLAPPEPAARGALPLAPAPLFVPAPPPLRERFRFRLLLRLRFDPPPPPATGPEFAFSSTIGLPSLPGRWHLELGFTHLVAA